MWIYGRGGRASTARLRGGRHAGGGLQRTFWATVLFAAFAVSVTALLSWFSFRGVRAALETEFERRLESVASTVASQISPPDIADARLFGEDGQGYGRLQVLIEELRATSGAASASVLDTARVTIYDSSGPEHQNQPSRLDTLARPALEQALRGRPSVSRIYHRGDQDLEVGVAPVLSDSGWVAGLVAVEARVDYLPVLRSFGRSLTLTTLVIALAIGVLALLVIRAAWSAGRLEQRLSRAENLVAMGRLTATLAHEIKNPLAIIRGSAQRLGKLEPEAERMSQFVIEEVDRLSRTVARYLQFARGEQTPGDGGDAAEALKATLDLLEGEFMARKVVIARDVFLERAPVTLDNESLKQVYLNLILNAVEAMADGGRITIGVDDRHGRVEATVADDGPGIPADVLQSLGNPFFSTKAQGSGLGLFLTRRLVQSAGGSLEIMSEVGRGTVCTIRLPRRKG